MQRVSIHAASRFARLAGVSGAVAIGCGSGAGAPARAIRADPVTASSAVGEAPPSRAECRDVSRGARPLIVDWPGARRADLEVAMGDGVAVVAYDCERIELLTECRAEGTYGFKGVVLKEQVVRLEDADEIRVNLPLSGASIVAKLGAELERGTTLDLAMALVGRRTSTRAALGPSDLRGACRGATHFVRSATVGAFALATGSRARVAAAAELLGGGTSAASESTRLAKESDGSLADCKKADAEAEGPPGRCQALLRLHLLPLGAETQPAPLAGAPPASSAGASASAAPSRPEGVPLAAGASAATAPPAAPLAPLPSLPPEEELGSACPLGMVLANGKCTRPSEAVHTCDPGDAGDCERQCGRDEPASCTRLGNLRRSGKGATRSESGAAEAYEKACRLDHAGGCANLGLLHALGAGVGRDERRAAELFGRACDGGDAVGCFNLAALHHEGRGVTRDAARAASLYRQACDAGHAPSCVNLGVAYDDGAGVAVDAARALALFERACEGDVAAGCTSFGFMLGNGRGAAADPARAVAAFERACALGSARGCHYLGQRLRSGNGTAADPLRARRAFERACAGGEPKACAAAKE